MKGSPVRVRPSALPNSPDLRGFLGDPPMSDLRLAISEALTNAVLHAYRDREPGSMTVVVAIDAERGDVTVRVIDDDRYGHRGPDALPAGGLSGVRRR
jgi:two-component sensor histidine kinase